MSGAILARLARGKQEGRSGCRDTLATGSPSGAASASVLLAARYPSRWAKASAFVERGPAADHGPRRLDCQRLPLPLGLTRSKAIDGSSYV
jgi:hypothetical protein